MAKRDYYEVLGISKNADASEIKKAYRKQAKKYHPDTNSTSGAEDKFKEIQEAYEVLGDPQKKATYDQYGHSAFDQNGNEQGFGGFSSQGGGFGFDDLNDIFGSFFGGSFGGSTRASQANAPMQGDDRFTSITIDFLEAVHGVKKDIEIMFDEECDHCHGTGAEHPEDVTTCPNCNGTGVIREQVRTPLGTMINERTCPHCHGTGKIVKEKCHKCHGAGTINKRIKVELSIPAGINDGQQLRVTGKGEKGVNGGPYGDLYVEINIKRHEYFNREGNDVYLNVPVAISDAVLGTKLEVPTVDGKVEFSIPEGTQPNTKFRLKNKGIKDIRTHRPGHQYIIVEVVVPNKLSKEQKALFENLREIEKKDDDSILSKLKKLWK